MSGPPTSRRIARETAIALLYEAEIRGDAIPEVVERQVVAPPEYAGEVLMGIATHQADIDSLIAGALRGWTLERLPALDRAVLRLAVYELGHRPEIPTTAVVTEAVELASQYSTEESGRFVNGVVATLAERLRGT